MFITTMYKSAIQEVYWNTINEFREEIIESLENAETYRGKFSLNAQSTVVNISDIKNLSYLINKYHISGMQINQAFFNTGTKLISTVLFNMLDIIKVKTESLSYEEAITVTMDTINNSSDDVFGVIFVHEGNDKTRFSNPFHPIISSRFIANKDSDAFKNVKEIVFYVWNNKIPKRDPQLDRAQDIDIDIAAIIDELQNLDFLRVENRNIEFSLNVNKTGIIRYDQYVFDSNNNEIKNDIDTIESTFLVPCQIANIDGVAFPYYGSVAAIKGKAYNISPFFSPNILAPHSIYAATGSRVCTHSGRPYTTEGIAALNHANFTSPLNSDAFKKGALEYAEKSLQFSIELYKEHLNVNRFKTYEEYKQQNPEARASEYIIYTRKYYEQQKEENTTGKTTTSEAVLTEEPAA